MRICVFEDRGVALLDPLTLTRPAFDLRCGVSSLLEHQCRHFAAAETGALVRPALAELCRLAHPGMAVNDPAWLRGGPTVLVNARWLPPAEPAADVAAHRVALVGDQIAYAVLRPDRHVDASAEDLDDWASRWRETLPQSVAGGQMIAYPWDLVEQNAAALGRAVPPGRGSTPARCPPGAAIVGPEDRLFIDPSAEVEPLVLLDTRKGPILIDREARVKAFSRLEGPCSVGQGTWVLGAQVSGSTLGPVCRVGGEVENSILHGYSNKAHEGFLGHSYVGEWVNLAAGTQVSDLRADYQPISMAVAGTVVPTGRTKIGAFLGDHTKTGINTLVNTGTSAGVFCQIFPSTLLPPRVIPSFCSFARGQLQQGPALSQLLATAATMMGRRGAALTDTLADFFRRLHEQTAPQRERAVRASQARGSGGTGG
jgi:UDP-N-acetylglucosamine diphosphorylase/glucosamine-1-phosphate N-acetyltransferase